MKKTAAVAGVVASALAIGGASAVALAAPSVGTQATAAPVEAAAIQLGQALSPFVRVANVQGTFAASQDVVTPVSDIMSKFCKAAAAMCASLPDYDVTSVQGTVSVSGDVERPFEGTIAQMAESEGSVSYTLACACASNIPGGGAIVNASVEGVSLASIAVAAGA